jgi:hypothetical protein
MVIEAKMSLGLATYPNGKTIVFSKFGLEACATGSERLNPRPSDRLHPEAPAHSSAVVSRR